ncbi:MAG: hypothetical protein ABSC71_11615 [Candidatus Acidiferrales bacterium]
MTVRLFTAEVFAGFGVRGEKGGRGEAERQEPVGIRNAKLCGAGPDVALIGGETFDGAQSEIFVSLVVLRFRKVALLRRGFCWRFIGVLRAVIRGRGRSGALRARIGTRDRSRTCRNQRQQGNRHPCLPARFHATSQ